MQSLIHSQFSRHFNDFIKYSLFKSGYLDQRPPNFFNPVEFCFAINDHKCSICLCNKTFILCANCEKTYCFEHFYVDFHLCI